MTKTMILHLIYIMSLKYGVDPQLSLAVAKVESGLNPNVISKTHDVGLFQLNEQSFKQYSRTQLLDPELNINEGIKYLAKMQKECKYKDNNEFLVCYNAGPKKARQIKHPSKWPYRIKVLYAMENL